MADMMDTLQRSWWIFLLRGVSAIVFGIMAFAWPTLTLSALVMLFGAYVLVDGIVGLIDAARNRDRMTRVWPLVFEAAFGIVVGLLTLLLPGLTLLVLLMVIAAWAVVGGMLRIVLAFKIRHEITGEWFLIVGGMVSILFGVLLSALPQVGLVTLAWVIGIFAMAVGTLFLALALRLRNL
ncbi:HdeD family acid-resistance protein [Pseudorhodobacter sp.]|uniref:HdeD family acid-resistance protein n=1 Tax=Pseudorhodobacter sp. TaxID=1934400 RepID=UPI002B000C50|nr:DUF308 domain-containing protein [Pseudorhodobacter sp.]